MPAPSDSFPAGLTIRTLTREASDVAAFREIRLEGLRLHPEAFGSSYEEEVALSPAEFAERVPLAPGAAFGAFLPDAEGKPMLVGLAGFALHRHVKARHKGVVWGMYVRAEHCGRGIASALLRRVLDHARETGCALVQLAVVADNATAKSLYTKAGFVTYGVETRALKLGPDDYRDEALLALDLDAPAAQGTLPGLRRARPEDAPAVAALVHAAYEKYVPRIGRKPRPMVADYNAAIARHLLWVVEEKGVLAAVLELIPEPDHLLIENIAVAPAQQGRGLGKRLMAFAEDEARRLGLDEMRLYTNEHFTEDIALYTKLGYRETRREPYKGTDLVHMAKKIG